MKVWRGRNDNTRKERIYIHNFKTLSDDDLEVIKQFIKEMRDKKMNRTELYDKALETYGIQSQEDMLLEEFSEVQKVILKGRRSRNRKRRKQMREIKFRIWSKKDKKTFRELVISA